MGLFKSKREGMRCAFCGKSHVQVRQLIASSPQRPRTYICNECVETCQRILEAEQNQKSGPSGAIKMGLSSIT